AVRPRNTSPSIWFSRNAGRYCSSPRSRSHSATFIEVARSGKGAVTITTLTRHSVQGCLTGQKIVRPVDRVDHPERRRIRVAGAALLTEKSIPREQVSKTSDDEIFAGAVCLAHKVLRALAVDPEQLPPGEIVGRRDCRYLGRIDRPGRLRPRQRDRGPS